MDKKLYQNAKFPKGDGGKFILNRMNERHRHLAKWGFSNFDVGEEEKILDIGCGGGANLQTLLQKNDRAEVFGVDYSEVSVCLSQKKNKKAVSEGRCQVSQGDVHELCFDDGTFDLITAFETVYFWKDINKAMMEIYRVLKMGGRFVICNEADGKGENDDYIKSIIDGMEIYSEEELVNIVKNVGFRDIKIFTKPEKNWISLICIK